jgi:hypothetical protein
LIERSIRLLRENWFAARCGKPLRLRSAIAIRNKKLMESLPWAESIVGIALSQKRTNGKIVKGKICLRLKVASKLPMTRIPMKMRIPRELHFDGLKSPILIDVVQADAERYQAHAFQAGPGLPVSAAFGGAGTIGMLMNHMNREYLVSAGHVLAPFDSWAIGDKVEAPPVAGAQRAASLAVAIPPGVRPGPVLLDCAAAELEPSNITRRFTTYPDGVTVDTPVDREWLDRDFVVYLFDPDQRAWHTGRITALHVHEEVDVPGFANKILYADQIECRIYNRPGLSGGLIHMATQAGPSPPISMHVAGNGTYSLSTSLPLVIKAIREQLDRSVTGGGGG